MAQERRRVPDNFSDGIIRLLTTTSCCMLLVIVTIKLSPHFLYNGSTLLLGDTGEKVFFFRATKAAVIAFLLLGLVIIVTVHHYYYKVIGAWTALACAMSLAILPVPCIYVIFEEYNEPADIYSAVFFVYNFMALSVVVIRLKGPRLLQLCCLTVQSTFMTLFVLMFLPLLAQLVMLCLILFRDLVVGVPTVVGILMDLDGMAKQRNESVESLHSGMLFSTSSTESGWDVRGIKLGLGDFVFYSVLVGFVVRFGHWPIVFTYVVCVLVGLCVTMFVPVMLAMKWEGVPSLPVSTLLGLSFVESHKVIGKVTNELYVSQALI